MYNLFNCRDYSQPFKVKMFSPKGTSSLVKEQSTYIFFRDILEKLKVCLWNFFLNCLIITFLNNNRNYWQWIGNGSGIF